MFSKLDRHGFSKKIIFSFHQGAYILDSIGNYNGSAGSQLLPETYQFQLPEFSQGVVRDGNRGDFIGVVGRRVDQPLYDLVSRLDQSYKHLQTCRYRFTKAAYELLTQGMGLDDNPAFRASMGGSLPGWCLTYVSKQLNHYNSKATAS